MNPVLLHVVRPYETEEDYLTAEAWTIESRGMLLIDQAELDLDATVIFDVALSSGTKVIRAEGRVVGHVTANDDRPGGLRIRFKRFGAQTKALIDRALIARERNLASGVSTRPPTRPSEKPETPTLTSAVHEAPVQQAPAQQAPVHEPPTPVQAAPELRAPEPSGIHRRPSGPVVAPSNRDQLLARLRERAALAAPAAQLPKPSRTVGQI